MPLRFIFNSLVAAHISFDPNPAESVDLIAINYVFCGPHREREKEALPSESLVWPSEADVLTDVNAQLRADLAAIHHPSPSRTQSCSPVTFSVR